MNLEKILKNYGLTEKQAKVYLACLELGSASVQKISQKINLARSTCYEVLDSLRQQNLISTYQKKKTKYFSAEDPDKIITMAKEKVEMLAKALPYLEAAYGKAKTRPSVRFYQGEQGMKLILDEVVKEARELLSFGSVDDLWETLGNDWHKFVKKRMKQKIPARVILRESKKARERQKLGPHELREVRIIPANYEHHGTIFVWKNKIAMFSFKTEHMALVIESEILAQSQRTMFNIIWDSLESK